MQNRIVLLVLISCASQRRMVSSSRFFLLVVKRRAGAVRRAGRKAICAQHFSRRVRPRARNGRIRRGFIPGPAREPGQGQTESVLTCRTIASASSSPNANRAYCQRTGASPSYPAASSNASLLRSLSFGSPFSRLHGRSSALICAPPSSDGWNITRILEFLSSQLNRRPTTRWGEARRGALGRRLRDAGGGPTSIGAQRAKWTRDPGVVGAARNPGLLRSRRRLCRRLTLHALRLHRRRCSR